MLTGLQNCPKCERKINVKEIKYPATDIAHDIGCPYCKETIGSVPKGTIDYRVSKAE